MYTDTHTRSTQNLFPCPRKERNYSKVENLEKLLEILKQEGVTVVDTIQTFEYGKFAHIMDPDGKKIELWEPNDMEYEKIIKDARTH